nr:MAG TPA: hypothetical protein [Caudoviricetes sp.]
MNKHLINSLLIRVVFEWRLFLSKFLICLIKESRILSYDNNFTIYNI